MGSKLGSLSGKVLVKSPTEVNAGRYEWLSLDNAEPNLGVPSANGEILASNVDGTRFWTSVAGPQGPVGAQGPQGVIGPTGPQGATGAQGPQGATGPTGPQGVTGAQGPQGATGPTGPQGVTGPTGAQGANGVDGSPGPAGPTGPQGAQGTPGLIDGNQSISGVKTFTQGTASTSTSTGTIVVSGNGGIGVGGAINSNTSRTVGSHTVGSVVYETDASTFSTTDSSNLSLLPTGTYRSARITVQAVQGNNSQTSEVSLTHANGNVTYSEYAVLTVGSVLYTLVVDISGGNVRVRVSGTNSSAISYTAVKAMIVV